MEKRSVSMVRPAASFEAHKCKLLEDVTRSSIRNYSALDNSKRVRSTSKGQVVQQSGHLTSRVKQRQVYSDLLSTFLSMN